MQYPPGKLLTSLLSGKAGATLGSKPSIFYNLLHQKTAASAFRMCLQAATVKWSLHNTKAGKTDDCLKPETETAK